MTRFLKFPISGLAVLLFAAWNIAFPAGIAVEIWFIVPLLAYIADELRTLRIDLEEERDSSETLDSSS